MNELWKNKFRSVILERGEDYYLGGEVDDLQQTDYGYHAVVHGSEDYDVDIYVEDEKVMDMDCDCPYAEDGNNCKHMAAVLFALTDKEEEEDSAPAETLDEILAGMGTEDLRRELKTILQDIPQLREKIFQRYRRTPAGKRDVRQIVRMLEDLEEEYSGRRGYIDWESGPDYAEAFIDLLHSSLDPMLERGENKVAFSILKEAYRILNNVDMDGSSGEHGTIASCIEGFWKRTVEAADAEEKREMQQWFKEMHDHADDLMMSDSIDWAYENLFDEEEYLLPLLKEIEKRLADPEAGDYELRTDLDVYKSVLDRLGMGMQRYEDWLLAHEDTDLVRRIRLEEAKAKNDLPKAIEILEKICEDSGSAAMDLHELMKLYRENGDVRKEKETIRKLIERQHYPDRLLIHRLRDLCSAEEWDILREEILGKYPALRAEIYYEEDLNDRLAEIFPELSPEDAWRYHRALVKDHSDVLRMYYYNCLLKTETGHPGNYLYAEIRKYLSILVKIEGGKKIAADLLHKWQKQFPTRRVLQQMIIENLERLETE